MSSPGASKGESGVLGRNQTVLPIVIGNPKRGMEPALSTGWLSRAGTVVLPSVSMVRGSAVWEYRVDEDRFLARFGRPPLESEMGCAAAHLSAYERLLSSGATWALVLEDDALVQDGEQLQAIVETLVKFVRPTGRILSLYSEGPRFATSSEEFDALEVVHLKLAAQGAVAYLLDRNAATNLLQAQSPIGSVSDWPVGATDLLFSYVPNSAIRHSTDRNPSTVAFGVDRSALVPVHIRLLMWSGLWYLSHRQHFSSFGDYVHRVVYPRVAKRFWRRYPS